MKHKGKFADLILTAFGQSYIDTLMEWKRDAADEADEAFATGMAIGTIEGQVMGLKQGIEIGQRRNELKRFTLTVAASVIGCGIVLAIAVGLSRL